MTTYTIHDLLYAKGTTEPVREMLLMLNDKAIKQEALIKELLVALKELQAAVISRGVISTVKALSKAEVAIAKAEGEIA